jgi:hypothetical protein
MLSILILRLVYDEEAKYVDFEDLDQNFNQYKKTGCVENHRSRPI